MNREDIYHRVVHTAGRFGAANPQEIRLLSSQLTKCEPAEVLAGLLLVFSRSEPAESNYQKQELAGRLLAKLDPKAPLDVKATLRSVLPAYNVSIEQLPRYLAGRHSKELVVRELLALESEEHDPRAQAAAKTMRWWLGSRDAS